MVVPSSASLIAARIDSPECTVTVRCAIDDAGSASARVAMAETAKVILTFMLRLLLASGWLAPPYRSPCGARRCSVRELGGPLLEKRGDRLGRSHAMQRHDLLAVLVLDRRHLGVD